MTSNSNNLGEILKQQRFMLDFTLHQLSTMSGVSASHLGRIERGERFPSAHTLCKIAKPLVISERELFTLAGYLTPQPSNIVESSTDRQLDPYVARLLSKEPVEMQRTALSIFSISKYIAKGIAQENSGSSTK